MVRLTTRAHGERSTSLLRTRAHDRAADLSFYPQEKLAHA